MVQPVLFFVLGFLSAGFLALLVAPSIWRRAVALTRQRVEASMPLTLSEIQASKDSLRAEYAMATRKLEMNVRALQERAAGQMVEIGRVREQMSVLERDHAAGSQSLVELRKANEDLQAALRQREEQSQSLSDRLVEGERLAGEGALELERLGQMYDEASFAASNRQIELVASESKLEALADDMAALRGQHSDALKRIKEAEAGREAANASEKKVGELGQKLDRLTATLADREEKLERREKELARLREQMKDDAPMTENKAREGNIEKAIGKLDAARERLEAKLTVLARENKKLKADLAGAQKSKLGASDASALREQIHTLAAEVVHLTSLLDGSDTAIATALASGSDGVASTGGERMISLADRVRALQKSASAG